MPIPSRLNHRAVPAALLCALMTAVGSSASFAAPLNLSKVPLFINSQVEPNFVLTFDDSGSMELSFVPDEADDGSAPITAFTPLYPDSNPLTTAGDNINTSCWWRDVNWVYSSTANPMYYNPAVTYEPPKRADGTTLPNSTITAAWEDGIDNSLGTETTTRNLTTNYRATWGASFNNPQYIFHATVANPVSTQCDPGTNARRVLPYGNKAFFYQFTGTDPNDGVQVYNNANYVAIDVTTLPAAQQTNFANWYSYYRTRNQTARTSLTRVFSTQNNLRVAWQNLNANNLSNSSVISTIANASTQRTNLYSFLMNTKHSGSTPNRAAVQRVGNYFGGGDNQNNDLNTTNPYYEPPVPPATTGRELSCRQNNHLLITDGGWNSTAGLNGNWDATSYTLPDGKVYTPNAAHMHIYSRQDSRTDDGLADAAFYYWSRDLRPNLTNNVPAAIEDLTLGVTGAELPLGTGQDPRSRQEIYWNPANDPATWQHVTQYVVAFGIGGTIPFPAAYNQLRLGTTYTWPWWEGDDIANAQKVDDTWHAALNGRGEFFSVRDPQGLIDSLGSVFASVERRRVKNTSVSVSSGLMTQNTLRYQNSFDSSDWSGKLTASIAATGGAVQWAANCSLTGGVCVDLPGEPTVPGLNPDSRKIVTFNGTSGVPFRWSSLSSVQQAALNKNPVSGATDALGSARLDYVRGVRTQERTSGGPFRARTNILGAMVNSITVVPRAQESYFTNTSSSAQPPFGTGSPEQANKASYVGFPNSLLFVGANDGMMHAFDRITGTEAFAFVPNTVVPNLNKLTSETALDFQSYVDGSPILRDAYVNGAWRRVLLGSLRMGGQGIYALDVSDSAPATEAALASKVMWEFSDKSVNGADLGLTFGNPEITRLADGNWVALVPGGYNSETSDGVVGSGRGVLFVLNLANGSVIRKFDLGAGSAGLMTAIPGDYRVGDETAAAANVPEITDVAFAGDLNGDVWRFNFEGTTAASWSVVKFFDGPANQPITVQPRIMSTGYEQPQRQYIVLFGTGKYLEPADRVPGSGGQQSFYGVFDQGPGGTYPITQASLFRQTISESGSLRTVSSSQLPLFSAATGKGWYVNLPASGERNVSTAVYRNSDKLLIFSTLIPRSDDPCQPAVDSWVMLLDGPSGGAAGTAAAGVDDNGDGFADRTESSLLAPAFDTNNDGQITTSDLSGAAGQKFTDAVPTPTPVTYPGGGIAAILIPGSGSGAGDRILIADYQWRRRSWRELNTDN